MASADKLDVLGDAAQFDVCAPETRLGQRQARDAPAHVSPRQWIYQSVTSDGRSVPLFKVLMSNDCANNCAYCVNRCESSHRRMTFAPEELARLFMRLHDDGLAEGLFLSSAIRDEPDRTMDAMIEAVEILRYKLDFKRYVHLKVLPGASFDRVERAAQLADRISVNLEAPNAARLHRIAPDKQFDKDLLLRMRWIQRLVSSNETSAVSQTTQFVVGASGESDTEILRTTQMLHDKWGLERAYFSTFRPVEGSDLADLPPTPPLRGRRLYEAEFLFKQYGFTLDELVFEENGNLPLGVDPKKIWAETHPERFPVEINRATRDELLRVPGIGPRSVSRILTTRRKDPFHSIDELKRAGAVTGWAAPYIIIAGKRPPVPSHTAQLDFWET